VFLSQAADRYRAGTLPALIWKASRKLLAYGLVTAAGASVIVAPLMPVIFGREWEPTRWIIPLLTPLFLGQLIVSPLSMAFVAAEKNSAGLIAQTALMGIRLAPLLASIALFRVDYSAAIAIYSGAALLGYLTYLRILTASIS